MLIYWDFVATSANFCWKRGVPYTWTYFINFSLKSDTKENIFVLTNCSFQDGIRNRPHDSEPNLLLALAPDVLPRHPVEKDRQLLQEEENRK